MFCIKVHKHSSKVITNARKTAQVAHEIEQTSECWWGRAGTRKLALPAKPPCYRPIHWSSSPSFSIFSIRVNLGNSFLILPSSRAIFQLSWFSFPQDHVKNQDKKIILHKQLWFLTKIILHKWKQKKGYFRPGLVNYVICHATWQQHQQYWGPVEETAGVRRPSNGWYREGWLWSQALSQINACYHW